MSDFDFERILQMERSTIRVKPRISLPLGPFELRVGGVDLEPTQLGRLALGGRERERFVERQRHGGICLRRCNDSGAEEKNEDTFHE